MTILLPALAVAFAAFVWLVVRLINMERERRRLVAAIAAMIAIAGGRTCLIVHSMQDSGTH
ncbi:MAG TPA: hypothetical protein VGM05_12010 [Planctomycetaceae bacterium]|jgi:hypothetical protein